MSNNPIQMPGGYATAFAIGFADGAEGGNLAIVDTSRPLPVASIRPAPAVPVAGMTSANGTFGPFTPAAARPVYVTLGGTWQGTVSVMRSIDDGATMAPLTVGGMPWGSFTANACEPVWEENEDGASLYLSVTIASGSLSYRLSQ
ncbi:hypothetical protein WBP07_15110 [Novosphingobium sp. BL-8A]|uniref:hypothetical protein n=1 Tax=Novosphingobium sp. BL-8A TaxID=3127639 RepID=UPI003757DAE8